MARPTGYTKELASEICEAIATSDTGLKQLCEKNPHWPSRKCIHEWRIKYPEFSDSYAQAKQRQIETIVDACFDIADHGLNDTYLDANGNVKVDTDIVQRSRLRIDFRKWVAAKLLPKLYGEKPKNEDESASASLMSKLIDKL